MFGLPGSGAKLYDARDYSYDFEFGREESDGTLVESAEEAIARFVHIIR